MNHSQRAIVKVSACGIFKDPNFKSEMVNQVLMWEEVIVTDSRNDWFKIKLVNDSYIGWIHKMYLTFDNYALGILDNCEMVGINYDQMNIYWAYPYFIHNVGGVRHVIPLSLGQKLPCTNYNSFITNQNTGAIIKFFFNNDLIDIILNGSDCVLDNQILAEWEISGIAECLIGYPYLWGGRSYQGYDCSGFIQSVFNLSEYKMPRDTKDQINANFLEEIKLEEAYPGCLLFFGSKKTVNHVAIVGDSFHVECDSSSDEYNDSIIHASGSICEVSLEKSGLKSNLIKVMKIKEDA